MPGYAIYHAGVEMERGTIVVNPRWRLYDRLRLIGEAIGKLGHFDVVLVEGIPNRARGGKFSNKAHASLMQSVGAAVSCSRSDDLIYVDARLWHEHVPEGYEKSDAGDACAIGEYVIHLAREKVYECDGPGEVEDAEGVSEGT